MSGSDFELALRELVPSVSQGEMGHYRTVQKKFAHETINTTRTEKAQRPPRLDSAVESALQSQDDRDLYDPPDTVLSPTVQSKDKGKDKAKQEV